MKLFSIFFLSVIGFGMSLTGTAEETPNPSEQTVQQLYPDLTSGALRLAVLAPLPEGILLKAGPVEISQETITNIIDSQPASVRDDYKKNAFFLLEQEAVEGLLLELASKALTPPEAEAPKADFALIERFFETVVFRSLEVSEAEMKAFYDSNPDLFGGASFEQVKTPLKAYLLDRKKQQTATEYIRKLGEQIPIRLNRDWTVRQAEQALDNPVDKARRSGKPTLADFGADGCRPCDMMTPILQTLRRTYEGKLNVVFVHVREHPILASRYGIQSIPVQVFYDAQGREVFRHEGFFPQDEIEKKLKEMGVQ
jgi:thiol-disulfide isomerase/thioredoxin